MKSCNYILIILLFGIINVPIVNANSLKLYLYNADEIIRFDKYSPEKIDINTQVETNRIFDREGNLTRSTYEIELISSNNNVSPILLPIEIQSGAFNITVPYYEHIIKVNILKNGTIVDTADVSQYSTCNSNLVCEYEKGENNNTCIADCLGNEVKYSEQTQQTLQANNGVIRDEAGTILLNSNTSENSTEAEQESQNTGNIAILIGGIIFLIAGAGIFVWKLRKR